MNDLCLFDLTWFRWICEPKLGLAYLVWKDTGVPVAPGVTLEPDMLTFETGARSEDKHRYTYTTKPGVHRDNFDAWNWNDRLEYVRLEDE